MKRSKSRCKNCGRLLDNVGGSWRCLKCSRMGYQKKDNFQGLDLSPLTNDSLSGIIDTLSQKLVADTALVFGIPTSVLSAPPDVSTLRDPIYDHAKESAFKDFSAHPVQHFPDTSPILLNYLDGES